MRRLDDPRRLLLWGLGLFLLLALVGWQQYRWVGALSQADRERTMLGLEQAAGALAYDFDRLLSQVVLSFVPAPGLRSVPGSEGSDHGRRLVRRWQRVAAYPNLLRAVYLGYDTDDGRTWRALDRSTGGLTETDLPADVQPIASRLPSVSLRPPAGARVPRNLDRRRRQPATERVILADDVPALVVPLRGERQRGRRPSRELFVAPDVVVLWLDRTTIQDIVLPTLVRRHFAATTAPFRIAVLREEEPRTLVFRSGFATAEPIPATSDASVPLFGLLPPARLADGDLAGWLGADSDAPRPGIITRGLVMGLYERLSQASSPKWILRVSHAAGSVDVAVRQARIRNMALGLGVLGLLAVALTLLLLATRRMQGAARQQLDFVAGVTHELRTPVAAMRVAGQNLADGVVHEPERVARYGRLIEREGLRLTSMIERVLTFAGIQSGQQRYRRDPVAVADVVEAAVDEMRMALDEAGMQVERTVAADLPLLNGDRTALVQALRNLVENAVKYAASGGWLGIDARATPSGVGEGTVVLSVSDRGPGVPKGSRNRIFDPFVRGVSTDSASADRASADRASADRASADSGRTDAVGHHVGGSGLGLSLVRDIVAGHGGRVTLTSTLGSGSTFSLHLPCRVPGDETP